MESRWYVPPGKQLKTTKIKDRKHELHVSKDNWDKVTGHLDRNRLIQEAHDAEEQKKQAMRETAEAMTKNWSDCLKNIKDKQLPESEDKIAKNLELYQNLRKEQEEERRIYVEAMRNKMARHTDYPKALSSALLLSEVVYERDRQIELDKKLKARAQFEDMLYAEKVRKDAGDEVREKKEEAIKKREKGKAYERELKEMIDENERERNEEYRSRIEREKKENEFAEREEKMVKEYELKKFLEKRAVKKRDNEQQMIQMQQYKEMKKKEEEELDAFSKIVRNYRDRIMCLTKKRELDAQTARMQRANEFGERLRVEKSNYDAEEDERIRKYVAKQDAETEARNKADLEKRRIEKEILTKARNDYWDQVGKDEARQKEIKKWQLLNNCKTAEETKKFEERLRQRIVEKGLKTKLEWDADLEYKKSVQAIEDEEERKATAEFTDALQREDDYFYEYADEVMEFVKSRGRITYPIENVVKQHKRNILKMTPDPKPCAPAVNKDLVNKTPGKMAHHPSTDPNYAKSQCKCGCHKDVLYK